MAMIDKLDLNVKFIKGTKRPFGFLIYIEDIKFEYKINSTKISLFRYSK